MIADGEPGAGVPAQLSFYVTGQAARPTTLTTAPSPRIGDLLVEWPGVRDDRTLGVGDFAIFPHLDVFPTNSYVVSPATGRRSRGLATPSAMMVGMRKAGVGKILLMSVAATTIALVVLAGAAVVNARAKTPEIVAAYYESAAIKMSTNDLSVRQIEILLKVEDPSFYEHGGVDFATPGAGWTTITQALAKKFYFREFRQGPMKIPQTLYAMLALDPLVPKDEQLDLFINILYFGNGQTGLVDASDYYYYGKRTEELNENEYISLVGSLIAPNELNPKDHPRENAERVRRIERMLDGSYKPRGLFDITYDKD